MAGIASGFYCRKILGNAGKAVFRPQMDAKQVKMLLVGWREAVAMILH